jgi:predicted DNA-binding transcriptional regulator AlpA
MRFLSKKEVKALVTYSFTHMSRLEAEDKFPKRLRLGKVRYARVVYVETEVLAWMEAKIAVRDQTTQTTP